MNEFLYYLTSPYQEFNMLSQVKQSDFYLCLT